MLHRCASQISRGLVRSYARSLMQTSKAVLATSVVLIVFIIGITLFQQRQSSALTRYGTARFAASVDLSWQRQARDVPTDGVTVFTIVTSPDSQELKYLIASSPYDVKILGLGQKFEKYRSKAILLLEAIRSMDDSAIIIYVDAVDASFFPCGRDLLQNYLRLKADIVFQADDFDWPDLKDDAKATLFDDPPAGAPHRFRYLCAGAWMGKVSAVKWYLSRYFLSTGAVDQKGWDDQRFWRNLYLAQTYSSRPDAQHVPKLALDFHGDLFQMFRPYATYLRDAASGAVTCPSLYKQQTACIMHAEGPKKGFKSSFYELLYVYLHTNATVLHQGED